MKNQRSGMFARVQVTERARIQAMAPLIGSNEELPASVLNQNRPRRELEIKCLRPPFREKKGEAASFLWRRNDEGLLLKLKRLSGTEIPIPLPVGVTTG